MGPSLPFGKIVGDIHRAFANYRQAPRVGQRAGTAPEPALRLVKFVTDEAVIYINPDHVVAVFKGLKSTTIATVAGNHVVREKPEDAARMLGAEDIAIDVTPQLMQRG